MLTFGCLITEVGTKVSVIERNNNSFQFRDGDDHLGKADFQEISDGYNDGELSDNCLVFVVEEDEWLPIEKFLRRRKKAKCSDNRESSKLEDVVQGIKKQNDESSKMNVDVINGFMTKVTTPELVKKEVKVIDSSREKKKPSRDSTSWGKSAPIEVIPSTCLLSDSTMKEPYSFSTNGNEQITQNSMKSKKCKKGNSNHIRPPPKIMRYIIQAIMQFEMIKDGDRLLLGLSGGKDSLTLLHCRK